MNQARVVDINVYYRRNGVDWPKLAMNFEAVIISAGVGTWRSGLLEEQVSGAVAHAVPYATYFIPDVTDGSLADQADFYLQGPGVREALTCVDLEKPSRDVRSVTLAEAIQVVHQIEDRTGKSPMLYSNPKNMIEQNYRIFPNINNYWWWLAQYPYADSKAKTLFSGYEDFLARYAGLMPYYIRVNNPDLARRVILWQFTCSGDAQELCARASTDDPVYKWGIRACDLNVSTVETNAFLAMLGGSTISLPTGPGHISTSGRVVNLRSAPEITPATDIGDILATRAPVVGETGDFWKITGYVAKSVSKELY
jgi:GH25 family lysozyme M1 (1,4-beta-N-acetylmuramidase)